MSEESELQAALLAAATGYDAAGRAGDHWPAFLSGLARAIGAEGLCLLDQPQDRPPARWQRGLAPTVPAPADIGRMRLDRVYSQIDLPGPDRGGVPLRALRSAVPGGGQAVLLAGRTGRDFRAVDAVLLSTLGPAVARALAGWRALSAERGRAALDRAAAQRLGLGWLLLTPAGRVTEAAPGGADLLARAGLRLRVDGWLDFADAAQAQGFARALAGALRGQPGMVPSPDPALRLALQRPEGAPTSGAILWLRRARPLRDLRPEPVAEAFGLNRSEARLALRLADGQSLAEAAADLGWTLETARSCSKQIFARMAVRGQVDLVRTLLLSPFWLTVE